MADSPATRPAPVEPEPISGTRMVVALGSIGVWAAVVLVLTYLGTLPAIERNRAEALERAIFDVVPGAVARRGFEVRDGELVADNGEPTGAPLYYAAYDPAGRLVGVAVPAEGQGFQDVLRVLYGYAPECRCIVGFKVLESKETPGLGDKIETDPVFRANFDALDVSLDDAGALLNPPALVKRGQKTELWQVEGITGATISARAVTNILGTSSATAVPLIERNLEVLADGRPGDQVAARQ